MDPSFFPQHWPPAPTGFHPGMMPPHPSWFQSYPPFPPDAHGQEEQQHHLAELQPMAPPTNYHHIPPPSYFPPHYIPTGTENTSPDSSVSGSSSSGHYYAHPESNVSTAYMMQPDCSSDSSTDHELASLHDQDQWAPAYHYPHPPSVGRPPSSTSFMTSASETSGDFIVAPLETSLDETVGSNDSPPTLKKQRKQPRRGKKRKMTNEGEEERVEENGNKSSKEKEQDKTRPISIDFLPATNQTAVFCKVVGRLSVVGYQKLYHVTDDEIERRTALPERLNRSHLGPLLRRGKIKGCGDTLQELLEKRGLTSLNTINRKQYPLTTLSALLEEEGSQLNADHREIAFEHFPFIGLSRILVRGYRTPGMLAEANAKTTLALAAVSSLVALLKDCFHGEEGGVYRWNGPFRLVSLGSHGLAMEEAILMASILERFFIVLEHETATYMATVDKAALVDRRASILLNEFPDNVDQIKLPDGRLHVPDDDEEASGSRSFAEIPGRLSLNNKKYNVTVAEIFRRVRAPESLNLSILGSQLRKGKTKDNGNSLRDNLAEQGIKIDQGRRKSAKITSFTAMLEGEALDLAEDLKTEVGRNFPIGAVATELNIRNGGKTPQERNYHRIGLEAASFLSNLLRETIHDLRLPIFERIPHRVNPEAYLIHTYSSLTHGYGPDTVYNWIATFCKVFDHARALLPLQS